MAERIKVFVRIRPSVDDQKDSSDTASDFSTNFEYDIQSNQFRLKQKIYTIDAILPPPTEQIDVYHTVATNQINAFLQGFNVTIFAYGQTGSGKTHTIFGENLIHKSNEPDMKSVFGLVPRCFMTVLEKLQNSNHIKKHQLDLSCVEVYNTNLNDLLKPLNSCNLKIREDSKLNKFFVQNLSQETIQTSQELMFFIKCIQLNRAVCATNMNHTSSRSHVLIQLRVIQQLLSGESKESLLTFVDLAGSEMVRKTGTVGNRLKEAGYINSSLSTLSRVIEGLRLQHPHIPFRDSSLTKLLKTTLGGNCKTTLVVCVSQDMIHKEETYSSLRFATHAACIKNEPVINKALDAQALYDENIILKLELKRLQCNGMETKQQENINIFEDTQKMMSDTIQFRQSMKELLDCNNENKMFREMFIKYMQIENNECIDLNNMNPMDLVTVCKGMNGKIERLELELDEQYKFKTKNIYGSLGSIDESLSIVESLSSDDESVLNENDIKLIVDKQDIIENSEIHKSLDSIQLQSDIESADITDTECSIFDIFKCIS